MGIKGINQDLTIGLTQGDADLYLIKALQVQNLRGLLTSEEAFREGFTTAEYSIEYLRAMHEHHPSVIAKQGDLLAGYILITLPALRYGHPLLEDLFQKLDHTMYRGKLLRESSYVVVGQLCVAKAFRGKGLVQEMYRQFRDSLSDQFEYCACDVDCGNPRSLNAHRKTGFEQVDRLTYGGSDWDILIWDWR